MFCPDSAPQRMPRTAGTQSPSMQDWLSSLGLAVVVFASTNIDDIILLSVFFADPAIRTRPVIAGQFLGIGAIVAVSIAAGLASLAIPPGWVALLGLAPLLLGIRGFFKLFRKSQGDAVGERTEREHRIEAKTRSQVLAVASVTMANGGDNLGVYIPLFAKTPSTIPINITVFAVMTALWCLIGYGLVKNPLLSGKISRYGHIALPFVLVGLGLHILWGARMLLF